MTGPVPLALLVVAVLLGSAAQRGTGVGFALVVAPAGLAGPALAAFALLTRWPHERFVATVQPYLVIVGAGTVAVTLLADTEAWPAVPGPVWLALEAAVLAGRALGGWAQAHLPDTWARAGVLVVSVSGAVVTMMDGLLGNSTW